MIPLMTNNTSLVRLHIKELNKYVYGDLLDSLIRKNHRKNSVFKKGSEVNASIEVLAHSIETSTNQNQQLQLVKPTHNEPFRSLTNIP